MNNLVDFVFNITQWDPVLILHLRALSSIPNIKISKHCTQGYVVITKVADVGFLTKE